MIRTILVLLLTIILISNTYAAKSILILGDSISTGYGLPPGQNWPALLTDKLNREKYDYQVVNASMSGITTSESLVKLEPLLFQHQPIVTIIAVGGNDGLRGLQPTIIRDNLIKMINLCLAHHSKVIVLGVRLPPNYGPAYIGQFIKIFTDLSYNTKIQVIPNILRGIDDQPGMMQSDGIHPVSAAQPVILNNLWHTLSKIIKPTHD